jgi:hypothetical protein
MVLTEAALLDRLQTLSLPKGYLEAGLCVCRLYGLAV